MAKKYVETRLRDKSGRVFLDAKALSKRKGFTRFQVKEEEEFEEVSDESVEKAAKPKAAKKKAAKKAAEPKPAPEPAEPAPSGEEDPLANWE